MPADFSIGYADDAVMISKLGESCAPGTAEKVDEVVSAINPVLSRSLTPPISQWEAPR